MVTDSIISIIVTIRKPTITRIITFTPAGWHKKTEVYRLMSLQVASVIVFNIKGYLLYLRYVYNLHRAVVHFYFHYLGFSISYGYC